jgi:hypothetical protein
LFETAPTVPFEEDRLRGVGSDHQQHVPRDELVHQRRDGDHPERRVPCVADAPDQVMVLAPQSVLSGARRQLQASHPAQRLIAKIDLRVALL